MKKRFIRPDNIVNVKINLTFTIIILFILPCTSDDCVISVQIGTGKRNLFIAFTIFCKVFCICLNYINDVNAEFLV